MAFDFFIGLHHPGDAKHFQRACVSVRTLWKRKKSLNCDEVLVDSGAFTELWMHGRYRDSVETYARRLYELHTRRIVNIAAAVAQDYMCEPIMLAKTGLTILDHQRLTIERYDALLAELHRLFDGPPPFNVLPVLQGYAPEDYVEHIRMYGDRLKPGMWVGVGSICKRNGSPKKIAAVLYAIKQKRRDLKLHGFGIKKTSLLDPEVTDLLSTADSMAWSFAERKEGRNPNDYRAAQRFVKSIDIAVEYSMAQPLQLRMF